MSQGLQKKEKGTRSAPRKGKSPSQAVTSIEAPTLDHVRFVKSLALVHNTHLSGVLRREPLTSVANPALSADRYSNADDFRHDYLLYNVIRKYNDASPESAKLRVANTMEKFLKCESDLGLFSRQINNTFLGLHRPRMHAVLGRAARKIEKLLGRPELSALLENAGFSHGATALRRRTEGQAVFKYSEEYPEVTPTCAPLAQALINQSPLWSSTIKGFKLVEYNRVTTVPKDADIDRAIACEPTLNMFVQKAIGKTIRRKLLTIGIDLKDQRVNQQLALEGSLKGNLATIDLAAASDSISLAIVKLLIPSNWYDLLLTTRCDEGLLPDGSYHTYEKISSMGNGYTFELESLIFWAVTQACEDFTSEEEDLQYHSCSVYGDDIVCRTETVPLLKEALAACGFTLNDEKSFWDGPFRESCGEHFWNGTNVSPFFIRQPIDSTIEKIGLLNRLRRWNRHTLGIDDPRYVPVYQEFLVSLPQKWQKPRIPDGFGDGALFGTLDEVLPDFLGGTYSAVVLSNQVQRLRPGDEGYKKLLSAYDGLGGYTAALKSADNRSISTERTIGHFEYRANRFREADSTTGALQVTVCPRTGELLVPLCGAYTVRNLRIKMYEWSDRAIDPCGEHTL